MNKKEFVSNRQMIMIMVMFIFGSSVVFGVSNQLGQNSWITVLAAPLMFLPFLLIFSRISKLFPEKNIYDISDELLGAFGGKVVNLLITWYALHLGAMVLRNFSEFAKISSMTETPSFPIMLLMAIVTTYMAISGIETFGKWIIPALFLVLIIVILTIVLSLERMEFTNFLPFLNTGVYDVMSSSYKLVTFPLAETVLFLTLMDSVKSEESPFKTFSFGIAIGSCFLLAIVLRNIAVLGSYNMNLTNFPSFSAAKIARLGNFLERIESSISYNFIFAGVVKISVCILAASKGIAHLFKIKNYRKIVIPTSVLMMSVCCISYKDFAEMINFINTYQIYAIPFEFIIPLFLWVLAEIRSHHKKILARRVASV